MPFVYILKSLSRPTHLYVGVTSDLTQRLVYHNAKRSPHTAKFIPWEIVYSEQFEEKSAALKRERQLKGWSRAKKEALLVGDMKRLKGLARRRGE